MTVHLLFKFLNNKLASIYDEGESMNISEWVFEYYTGYTKGNRLINKNKDLTIGQEQQINAALKRLLNHEPVQYILNESWFYKEKYFVDQNVLIPRPETEELVEWVLKTNGRKNGKILDIGTGSGCIAISLKKYLPNSSVEAIDVSEGALHVAKRNAGFLNADVNLHRVDFLDENNWKQLGQYDLIISNPPYIPISEKEKLSRNVSDHEPGTALFVENSDPFIFYKKIADFCSGHLTEGGKVFVEVHENGADEVRRLFEEGRLKEVTIRKDIYERDRMISAVK